MNDYPVVGRYPFTADSFFVDKLGRLRPGILCSYLISCASRHADERGFGHTDTLGWVLARFTLSVKEMPRESSSFFIETWVRNLYRGFTDRCYRVLDEAGREMASALSTFALMNLNTRSSVDLNSFCGDKLEKYAAPALPLSIERMPSLHRCEISKPVAVLSPQYSDIDSNGHMNSMRYLDHLLDLLPLDYLYKKNFSHFTIAYMHEAKAGENLSYFLQPLTPDLYFGQVNKGGGEPACRCEVQFSPSQR